MKKMIFEFDFLLPQSVIFQPSSDIRINVTVKVTAQGEVIDGNPTVIIKSFTACDNDFEFVEDNYLMYRYMRVAAMDEYKRLHCNARPISLNVVQLAEYAIVNIHPTQKHLN